MTVDWSAAHPRSDWFDVRQLEPGVHLIGEPGHVNSFLIEGSERAILLDTGLGVADIKAVAQGLSSKPLRVVNSHSHFDHVGGNRLFDDISIHAAGVDMLAEAAPEGLAESYLAFTERMLAAWPAYKAADDVYFHLLTAERLLRPLPADFDRDSYAIVPSRATTALQDGDVLDLGDRQLRVLHTPGHSPDSICLHDEANGLLFGGDTINTGPIYAHGSDVDLPDFAQSTARLAHLQTDIRRVFVCHFLRYDGQPRLLAEVAAGFAQLLAGKASMRPNVDFRGEPVQEACFDEFSIFVPAGFHAS